MNKKLLLCASLFLVTSYIYTMENGAQFSSKSNSSANSEELTALAATLTKYFGMPVTLNSKNNNGYWGTAHHSTPLYAFHENNRWTLSFLRAEKRFLST